MLDENKIINYMLTKKYDKNTYNCWDFVQEVYKKEYDLELPDYPVTEVPTRFKEKLKNNFNYKTINKDEAIEGDIIVFSCFSDQHAGIMLDNDNFIHISTTNVAISQINNIRGNYAIYRIIR